ncbi:hypothetical protein TrCOL_g8953 [Triparma columacea]|uniref:J domain-containing protein n=1 Tax=Triparma columacea TaxID=722753 RepID=A0A9W7L516_9STRA|nr:hypothetical protein TrCOL_g8953 [Triparma columacea]
MSSLRFTRSLVRNTLTYRSSSQSGSYERFSASKCSFSSSPPKVRPGLIFIHGQALCVQLNMALFGSTSPPPPILLRGKGFRYPLDSLFSPLSPPSDTADCDEIVDAVEKFYAMSKQSPNAIVFGGGFSEPLHEASSSSLFDAMRRIRENRHGVRFVVQTCGVGVSQSDLSTLVELNSEWKSAPGGDGDAKLEVWVDLLEGPKSGKLFGDICTTIATLVESSVSVKATLSTSMPPRKVKEISEMAKGMGCADVFFRSYTKEDIYDTLGVTANASLDEISSKYRELAKELHPDRNPDGEERMKEVIQAYEIARDEERRRLYDVEMRADLALDSSETDYLRSTNSKMA